MSSSAIKAAPNEMSKNATLMIDFISCKFNYDKPDKYLIDIYN
jgi:hypothetical protein